MNKVTHLLAGIKETYTSKGRGEVQEEEGEGTEAKEEEASGGDPVCVFKFSVE